MAENRNELPITKPVLCLDFTPNLCFWSHYTLSNKKVVALFITIFLQIVHIAEIL